MPRAPRNNGVIPSRMDYCCTLFFRDDDHAFAFTGRPITDNFNFRDPNLKYVIYQLEKCPTTGALHWQIFMRFKTNTSHERVKQCFASDLTDPAVGGKPPTVQGRTGPIDRARDYCAKEETRVMGPFEHGHYNIQGHRSDLGSFTAAVIARADAGEDWLEARRALSREFGSTFLRFAKHAEYVFNCNATTTADDDFVPRPWQREFLRKLAPTPDRRTIFWVYDEAGGKGKSRLGLHLICNHNAMVLSGRVADMAYAYMEQKSRIVVFDVTRTQTENLKHLYSFAESLKNGYFFNSKYNSRSVVFKPPHVVFFANVRPDVEAWTGDRLHLVDLADVEEEEVIDLTQE